MGGTSHEVPPIFIHDESVIDAILLALIYY